MSIIILIGASLGQILIAKNPGSEKELFFTVEKGEGSKEIALNLEEEGIIWWGPVFRFYVLTTGVSSQLQAGTYLLSSSMNIPKIVDKFVQGDVAKETITIPEGFTSEQILQKLQIVHLTRNDLVNLAALQEREGYLFPDTYEIPYGLELDKIIKIMTGNFDKKTAGLNVTDKVVVMASILEKELKSKADKEMAAGVLWKRLKIGMPLQVDAEMWTYENLGLPKKPISNPGLDSILAAIYPQDSQYWYYLTTPEGKTIFSQTLEEHNLAKAKYLK